jgi:uncharacterized protein YggT (Ycf19 family)
MVLFDLLGVLFWYLIVTIIIGIIVLVVLRLVVGYADLNPFGAVARTIKSLSDPLVLPMRSKLARAGLDPKFAPLITILIAILVGWFALQLVGDVLFTLKGLLSSAASGWVRAGTGAVRRCASRSQPRSSRVSHHEAAPVSASASSSRERFMGEALRGSRKRADPTWSDGQTPAARRAAAWAASSSSSPSGASSSGAIPSAVAVSQSANQAFLGSSGPCR